MILLVTSNNLLLLFFGWEGSLNCLKWNCNIEEICGNLIYANLLIDNQNNIDLSYTLSFLALNKKIKSNQRIGPHNIDVLSLIVGSLLGASHLEKRKNGIGSRILFEQSNNNVEYLMWFHKFLASRGYCNETPPKLHKRIKKGDQIFFHYRINSYTFSSFNWIHEMFYKWDSSLNKYVKIVPLNIHEFLTPMSLAIWFMGDGSKAGDSAKIATNCFTLEEIEYLSNILFSKYNIIATAQKAGLNKGHILYIPKKSMATFTNLIKPYMIKSLYYKLSPNIDY
jgi:hypothetical protein